MTAFSATAQILAVPVALLGQLPDALAEYGSALPLRPADPESPTVVTLLGHLDREGSPDLRAGELGVSVTGQPLTDGRLAFSGHWSTAFVAALATDTRLDGITLLTAEQLATLTPDPEEDLTE
jgi:hypothetical protein